MAREERWLQGGDERERRLGATVLIGPVGLQAVEARPAFGIPERGAGVVDAEEPADREAKAIVPVRISGDPMGAGARADGSGCGTRRRHP